MNLNYLLLTIIVSLVLINVINKERFVMDANGNIPDNLFIEKRIL